MKIKVTNYSLLYATLRAMRSSMPYDLKMCKNIISNISPDNPYIVMTDFGARMLKELDEAGVTYEVIDDNEKVEVIHELKCWIVPFEQIEQGLKTFELRLNDRDYKVGDLLILKKYYGCA